MQIKFEIDVQPHNSVLKWVSKTLSKYKFHSNQLAEPVQVIWSGWILLSFIIASQYSQINNLLHSDI